MRVRKRETEGNVARDRGGGYVPDDDPCDALHRRIIQVFVYCIQLRKEKGIFVLIADLSPSVGATTYQTPRTTDTFIESLDALPDLKVRPAGIVQRVQARLFPENTRHVEDVTPQYDVTAQQKELAGEPHRLASRECQ